MISIPSYLFSFSQHFFLPFFLSFFLSLYKYIKIGREKLSFLKLREIVEAEDSFADQVIPHINNNHP